MKAMTKMERIDAAIRGEPIDRIPVSFWRHFYQYEDTPEGLADAMLLFQEDYNWDFMKVNPRASYHHEDWGAEYKFFKDGLTKPERLDYPVKKLSDWEKIRPLDPLKAKILSEHVDALHLIKKQMPKHTYLLMTVFTPLSIAADLTESEAKFKEYMLEDLQTVKSAMEAITLTFEKFVTELLNVGISGLFFATTEWGNYDRLTDEEFDEFSRPYDIRILSIVKNCPFNILHVCKSNNMLKKLSDYPVHAFNWDAADPTNMKIGEGKEFLKKTVIGGIDHKDTLEKGTPQDCVKEAEEAFYQTDGNSWILGGGCTFNPAVPSSNLKALREWAEKFPICRKNFIYH